MGQQSHVQPHWRRFCQPLSTIARDQEVVFHTDEYIAIAGIHDVRFQGHTHALLKHRWIVQRQVRRLVDYSSDAISQRVMDDS